LGRQRTPLTKLLLSGAVQTNPGRYAARILNGTPAASDTATPKKPIPKTPPRHLTDHVAKCWKELRKQFPSLSVEFAADLERAADLLFTSRRPRKKLSDKQQERLDRYLKAFRKATGQSTIPSTDTGNAAAANSGLTARAPLILRLACRHPGSPRNSDGLCNLADCYACRDEESIGFALEMSLSESELDDYLSRFTESQLAPFGAEIEARRRYVIAYETRTLAMQDTYKRQRQAQAEGNDVLAQTLHQEWLALYKSDWHPK
jgi:hypothetical protein